MRPCAKTGCPKLVTRGRCAEHEKSFNQQTTAIRQQDEVSKWYRTARWARFRSWFLRQNPICQRIVDDVRCECIATLVHHRKSPRQFPELFTDADNTIALCDRHHHGHDGDVGDENYAPTCTGEEAAA